MTPLNELHVWTVLVGKPARPGDKLDWFRYPGECYPPEQGYAPGTPMHSGALLPDAAAIIYRAPHVFLIEPGGTWQYARPTDRHHTSKNRGGPFSYVRRAGLIKMEGRDPGGFMCKAVQHAAKSRAGALPTPGRPDTYARPGRRHHAAWLPWTAEDEAAYLAQHNPPTPTATEDKPMHRLEPEIARDAVEVEAGRAASALLFQWWQDARPGAAEADLSAADGEVVAACRRVGDAAARFRAVGGNPVPIITGIADAYRRVDPTALIMHRLALAGRSCAPDDAGLAGVQA